MKSQVILRTVGDEAVRGRVLAAAAGDDHAHLLPPTHWYQGPGDQVAGALSCGVVTLVHAWLHRDIGGRGVVQAFGQLDGLARQRGWPATGLPVGKGSALYPHMERFGYVRWMDGTIWVKRT